jgi:hypothetical protein
MNNTALNMGHVHSQETDVGQRRMRKQIQAGRCHGRRRDLSREEARLPEG